MFAKVKNILKPKSEKMTDTVVKRLVGHTNVVYYNCEINAWNTNWYNGFPIGLQRIDTKYVKDFQTDMEKNPEFSQQYDFSAFVAMTPDSDALYCVWGRLISNPQYSRTSATVVGNIIVRNKKTGTYELYGKSWVGFSDFCFPGYLVYDGAESFSNRDAGPSILRMAMRAAHTR